MKTILLASTIWLLTGCATGIKMTDAEAQACKRESCTVWTEQELQALVIEAMRQGFIRGAQSKGREI